MNEGWITKIKPHLIWQTHPKKCLWEGPCELNPHINAEIVFRIYKHSFTEIWDGEQRKTWLAKLDVQKCPACWFDQTNELIEYLVSENPPHVNFV